jgi:hypothetical protein
VILSAQIFNATEEAEAALAYTDIRFTILRMEASSHEMEDIQPQWRWSDPAGETNNQRNLAHMSAVCFLYARSLYDLRLARWGGADAEPLQGGAGAPGARPLGLGRHRAGGLVAPSGPGVLRGAGPCRPGQSAGALEATIETIGDQTCSELTLQ